MLINFDLISVQAYENDFTLLVLSETEVLVHLLPEQKNNQVEWQIVSDVYPYLVKPLDNWIKAYSIFQETVTIARQIIITGKSEELDMICYLNLFYCTKFSSQVLINDLHQKFDYFE